MATVTQVKKIVRAQKDAENPYFLIARKPAQDKDLSWEARGVLWYLLSKPDTWEVQIKDLMQKCGRDKVYKILLELKQHHYLEYAEDRNDLGRVTRAYYRVHEAPFTGLPETDKPDTANQDVLDNKDSVENTDVSGSNEPSAADREPPQQLPDEPTEQPSPEPSKVERGGEGKVKPVKAKPSKSSNRWRDVKDKWLFDRRLITDERFNSLNGRDKNTAIFTVICWYITRSVSNPEDVYTRIKRDAKTLEHRYLSALNGTEGNTPTKLRQFITEAREKSAFGAKLKDPEKLADHYRDWLRGECTLFDQMKPGKLQAANPKCPDCNGVGFWIDKSNQYNHKKMMCGCRVPEGVTNG